MKSPAIMLSRALASHDRDGLIALADRAGVTPRVAMAAFNDRPISADHFLRLCAVVGLDPVTSKRVAVRTPAAFDHNMLAVFVSARRGVDGIGNPTCAYRIGMRRETLFRIEQGTPVGIESILKACAYLGLGPFEFVSRQRPSMTAHAEQSVAPLS